PRRWPRGGRRALRRRPPVRRRPRPWSACSASRARSPRAPSPSSPQSVGRASPPEPCHRTDSSWLPPLLAGPGVLPVDPALFGAELHPESRVVAGGQPVELPAELAPAGQALLADPPVGHRRQHRTARLPPVRAV